MKIPPRLVGWAIAGVVILLRWTCRVCVTNDPRPELRRRGVRYVYSILHAHQIAAAINREAGTAAMVSQSGDGELLVPGFNAIGIIAVRGSSRTAGRDRGGAAALAGLVDHVATGKPAIIAVDGPRGPRGQVRKGIASLSRQTGAAVLNVVLVPRRRLIMPKAWDRFQVPLPFTCVDAYFAEPITPQGEEGVEALRRRIETSLNQLEAACDPAESQLVTPGSRQAA